MRTELFRGKNVLNNKWAKGLLCNSYEGSSMCIEVFKEKLLNGNNIFDSISVKDETIGRFTYLQDSNGTDIYEGDIVSVTGFEDTYYSINR